MEKRISPIYLTFNINSYIFIVPNSDSPFTTHVFVQQSDSFCCQVFLWATFPWPCGNRAFLNLFIVNYTDSKWCRRRRTSLKKSFIEINFLMNKFSPHGSRIHFCTFKMSVKALVAQRFWNFVLPFVGRRSGVLALRKWTPNSTSCVCMLNISCMDPCRVLFGRMRVSQTFKHTRYLHSCISSTQKTLNQ